MKPYQTITQYYSVTNATASLPIIFPRRSLIKAIAISQALSCPAVADSDQYVQTFLARSSDYTTISGILTPISQIFDVLITAIRSNGSVAQYFSQSRTTPTNILVEGGRIWAHYSGSTNATNYSYVTVHYEEV